MAKAEHVDALVSGPAALEAFRLANPRVKLDLTGADLRRLDLRRCDFTWADARGTQFDQSLLELAIFSDTDLVDASFKGATLTGTHFNSCHCAEADFYGVQADHTTFRGSTFWSANFRRATLSDVIFDHCDLCDAQFTGAIFLHLVFAGVGFSRVQGLADVTHVAESSIDLDTLLEYSRDLPKPFLVGCGVNATAMEYLQSIADSMSPIQFHSCFVSHSATDSEIAKLLHSRLIADGLRVWFAPKDLRPGRKVLDQIDRAIHSHDKLLLILSEHSMKSEWVRTEIRRARHRERRESRRVLFPVSIVPFDRLKEWSLFDADTGQDLATEIREYYIPDFSNWRDDVVFSGEYMRLLDALRKSAEA